MNSPSHVRLFLAIAVPEGVRTEIQQAQETLRRALPSAAVRWTSPEQFHLTLRFLGRVEIAHLTALEAKCRSVCAHFPALEMCAEDIGFFPERGRPRVAWVGVRDERNSLSELQSVLQAATLPFTSEPAEKSFTGHVTLARFKEIRRSDADALGRQAELFKRKRFGAWSASEVRLMRSDLSSAGARHTLVSGLPFQFP